ncbi:MAG: FGGY family carbohydrate kinase, partial [Thermoguttaceae bacterium]
MQYLLGIDLGTTGAKAVILSINGEVLGQGYYEYNCTYPKPLWVEQDVEMVVAKSMEAARDALQVSGVNPNDILAMSLSSQRCCTILVGDKGELVRPMIS